MKDGQSIETEQAPAPTDSRAAVLAELANLTEDNFDDHGSEPAASAEEGSTSEESSAASEEDDSEILDSSPPDDAPKSEPSKGDSELERRLAEVQRAEKAGKDAVARERAAFEKERAEWEAKRGEHQGVLDDLRARVKYDQWSVLAELGLTPDEAVAAARAIYAQSPEAQQDPKNRAASAYEVRMRKMEERVRQAEERAKQFETAAQQRIQAEANERAVQKYLDDVISSKADDTPIVAKLLEKSPDRARQALRKAARELLERHGEPADPVDVKRYLEQTERAELEARGVDVTSLYTKTKAPDTTGEKKQRPETMEPTGNPTVPPGSPKSREQTLAELRRGSWDGLE